MADAAGVYMDVNVIIDKLLDVRGARPGKQGACRGGGCWDGGGRESFGAAPA